MITVHLPAMLRNGGPDTFTVSEPVSDLAELIAVLGSRLPAFRQPFEEGLLNFAVNDDMVLVGLRQRTLHDGDRVEIIPTISGG